MSDTPRTDAAAFFDRATGSVEMVPAWITRELEREVKHWQRMYECAQNANAFRQAALEPRCHACGLEPRYEFCRDPLCPKA